MRIYYDEIAKNIVLGQANRLFATGSLEASEFRGRVSVIYKDTNFRELFIAHTRILKEDGSPAGSTLAQVINYLNLEFNKSPFSGGGSSTLTITSNDPISPALGQTWLLETIDNQAGTLQALIGGFPLITENTDYSYRFSVNTQEGIKRVLMT